MKMHTPDSLTLIRGIDVCDSRKDAAPHKCILAFLGKTLRTLQRESAIAKSVRELRSLDNRLLRDIGIEPWEIEEKARAILQADRPTLQQRGS